MKTQQEVLEFLRKRGFPFSTIISTMKYLDHPYDNNSGIGYFIGWYSEESKKWFETQFDGIVLHFKNNKVIGIEVYDISTQITLFAWGRLWDEDWKLRKVEEMM